MIQRLEEESASTAMEWDDHVRWDFVLSADACGWAVDANPFFFTSCIHGFGHGAHMMHRLDLKAGLDVCRAVEQRSRPLPPLQPWRAGAAAPALNSSPPSEHARESTNTSSSSSSSTAGSIFQGLETEMSGQCATGVFMELGDLTSYGWYGSEADAAKRVPPADIQALATYLGNAEKHNYRSSGSSTSDSNNNNTRTSRNIARGPLDQRRQLRLAAHSSIKGNNAETSSLNLTSRAEFPPMEPRQLSLMDHFSGTFLAMFGGKSDGSRNTRNHVATSAASLKQTHELSSKGRPSIGGRDAPLALRVATGLGRGLTPQLCASTASGSSGGDGGGRAVARACWFRRFTSGLGRRYVFEVSSYYCPVRTHELRLCVYVSQQLSSLVPSHSPFRAKRLPTGAFYFYFHCFIAVLHARLPFVSRAFLSHMCYAAMVHFQAVAAAKRLKRDHRTNNCVDLSPQCSAWATAGECDNNPVKEAFSQNRRAPAIDNHIHNLSKWLVITRFFM